MTQRQQKPLTGADVIVETLEALGVTHIFGVPGAKIDRVYDRLLESSIQTVVCRHEQNAAFIAGGIGRMTGKAGVALVTSGPGVSNLATGLVTAKIISQFCLRDRGSNHRGRSRDRQEHRLYEVDRSFASSIFVTGR